MWRIGAVVVVVGALIVLAAGPVFSRQQGPVTSREGLVSNNDSSLYYARHRESSFAVYLPGDWGSSTRSSSNTASNAWKTDVTLRANGKPDVALLSDSTTPTQVAINGIPYELGAGSVFRIDGDGKVEQLPFAPLPSGDQGYLKRLSGFFSRQAAAD
jgi:hypothetical protein